MVDKHPFTLLFILFLCSCGKSGKVIEKQIDPSFYEKHFGLSREQFYKAKEIGLFLPDSIDCAFEIKIQPPIHHDISLNSMYASKEDQLVDFVGQMYMLCGDPVLVQDNSYDFNLSTKHLERLLRHGAYAPQCEGIAKLCKVFGRDLLHTKSIDIVRTSIVEHTLNTIMLDTNKSLFFDAQNGYLYPSLSPDSLVVPLYIEPDSLYHFYWLEDSILNKKRNFTDRILPCNFLPQLGHNYHKMPKGSTYTFEILGPSFHKVLWFDLGELNVDKYKKELNGKL